MSRDFLKIYHHRCLSKMAILFWVLLILPNYALAAEDTMDQLQRFLKNDMAFSEKEFKSFKEGKTVAKTLKTGTKHEIGIFGIAEVNVPRELFLQNYEKKGMNVETASATSWGIIKVPPQIEDLKEITLPKRDLDDLAKCKPGDCKVKAPIEAIEKIGQLDAKAPNFEEKANQLIQEDTVNYLNRYLKNGNRGLVEYSDKKKPVRLAEQFQGLLKASPHLKRHVPELYAYLDEFPNRQLAHAEDIFIWLKEDFGKKKARPILSVNHLVFYRPQASNTPPIVAMKQIYATHYFEASLGLTAILENPAGNGNSIYLLNLSRARIDLLREVPGFLSGQLRTGSRDMLYKRISAVKTNMERIKGSGAKKN